jgi:hypothetical protein
MQTTRRYDPTKDAKFHVSIAKTEGDCPTRKRTGRDHSNWDYRANPGVRHDLRTVPRS